MGLFSFFDRMPVAQDCRLCGMASMRTLCAGCDADILRLTLVRCAICALPTPSGALCGRCLADVPAFDTTCAALEYAFPATRLIQAFKYAGAVGLSGTLADFLAAAVRATPERAPDLLLPMPLARERLAERGFNQALEIARLLGRRMDIPVQARAAVRVRHGPPQADLPLPERRRNVRGAYAARRRFDGLDVAVVDDVMTTGASLDALAAVLKQAGAARVRNWVVARTL